MSAPRGLTKPHHFLQLLPVLLIEIGLVYAAGSATLHLFQMGVL